MCCQITVDQYKPRQHQTFAIEKIPRFDRNNPIMSWNKKISFKKIQTYVETAVEVGIIFVNERNFSKQMRFFMNGAVVFKIVNDHPDP